MPQYNAQPQRQAEAARPAAPAGNPQAPLVIEFFKGEHMHPKLLMETAEGWAKKIMNAREKLTSHQLRRFYNDVKNIEKMVRSKPGKFEEYWPLVGMLKAKTAYASNPKKPKIPKEFKDFVDECVKKINGDEKGFLAFCKFFEAVVGYLYGEGIAER